MSDSLQLGQEPESLPLLTTTTTAIPKVSHVPQHWHHHQMTAVISSTPPPHSPHTHHSHRHSQSHHRTKLDYTVRPGIQADLDAIHKIYTYYALNSTITLLVHAPDIKYIEKAYESSMSRHMPYFVAVTKFKNIDDADASPIQITHDHGDSRTQKSNGTDTPEAHSSTISQESSDKEILLGYAHVTPLHPDKAGYGPSVELTMYMHPSYITFGIGSALFSALEQHLRETPVLIFEEGYQDKSEERLAEVIVSRMSDDMERDFEGVRMIGDDGNGDSVGDGEWPVWKAQGERNKEWYLRKGFEEVGRMKGVGVKFGRK